ncbi:hypothetical protein PILCRDRAFT_12876 [Piloderma croceum F 1598]|uniref:F-box domain-containing protein n=1 Tax=Piloderma croceum (strain F 1598) TaxID=765440 RepID=A0A0C3EUS6_PILCF|nr:hypothetical protein PILCRDRAFT_12876 [Piloderma croceum F 1598]
MVKILWKQIEHLDIETREVDQCLDLLHTTPNLKKCIVLISSSEPCQPHSPVQLLHLRSMIISDDPTYLFDTLLLPKLHEISIESWGTLWTSISQLTSLLSQCSFAKLSLQLTNPLFDDEMIQILQTCPSLVQLDLRWHASQCMTTSFFAQFAYHRDPENSTTQQLVPMLHTMNIDYSGMEFNIPDFANVIESRIISNSKGPASDDITGLQTVEICHRSPMPLHCFNSLILSQLRQLRETGLEIRFSQGGRNIL